MSACGCARTCGAGCACECHGFTSPEKAARAAARLSRLWDRARDMYSRAGLRPYCVSIVRTRATGMRARGDGPTDVIGEWAILPTPKIGDLTALTEMLDADQLREKGAVMLTEVSLSYSEDILLGRGESGNPIPPGETVFYEVRYLDFSGRVTARRRFVPTSPPYADLANAQWTISLTRAPWDRGRDGVMR